jgi:hypothetical protein
MGRSPGVIRRRVVLWMRRSSDGVEEVSDVARDARLVFQHSLFRKLYGIPLPPAPERMLARCDDITVGFQQLEPYEFVWPTRGTQVRRAALASGASYEIRVTSKGGSACRISSLAHQAR